MSSFDEDESEMSLLDAVPKISIILYDFTSKNGSSSKNQPYIQFNEDLRTWGSNSAEKEPNDPLDFQLFDTICLQKSHRKIWLDSIPSSRCRNCCAKNNKKNGICSQTSDFKEELRKTDQTEDNIINSKERHKHKTKHKTTDKSRSENEKPSLGSPKSSGKHVYGPVHLEGFGNKLVTEKSSPKIMGNRENQSNESKHKQNNFTIKTLSVEKESPRVKATSVTTSPLISIRSPNNFNKSCALFEDINSLVISNVTPEDNVDNESQKKDASKHLSDLKVSTNKKALPLPKRINSPTTTSPIQTSKNSSFVAEAGNGSGNPSKKTCTFPIRRTKAKPLPLLEDESLPRKKRPSGPATKKHDGLVSASKAQGICNDPNVSAVSNIDLQSSKEGSHEFPNVDFEPLSSGRPENRKKMECGLKPPSNSTYNLQNYKTPPTIRVTPTGHDQQSPQDNHSVYKHVSSRKCEGGQQEIKTLERKKQSPVTIGEKQHSSRISEHNHRPNIAEAKERCSTSNLGPRSISNNKHVHNSENISSDQFSSGMSNSLTDRTENSRTSHALSVPSNTLSVPSHPLSVPSHPLSVPSHPLSVPSHTLSVPSSSPSNPLPQAGDFDPDRAFKLLQVINTCNSSMGCFAEAFTLFNNDANVALQAGSLLTFLNEPLNISFLKTCLEVLSNLDERELTFIESENIYSSRNALEEIMLIVKNASRSLLQTIDVEKLAVATFHLKTREIPHFLQNFLKYKGLEPYDRNQLKSLYRRLINFRQELLTKQRKPPISDDFRANIEKVLFSSSVSQPSSSKAPLLFRKSPFFYKNEIPPNGIPDSPNVIPDSNNKNKTNNDTSQDQNNASLQKSNEHQSPLDSINKEQLESLVEYYSSIQPDEREAVKNLILCLKEKDPVYATSLLRRIDQQSIK